MLSFVYLKKESQHASHDFIPIGMGKIVKTYFLAYLQRLLSLSTRAFSALIDLDAHFRLAGTILTTTTMILQLFGPYFLTGNCPLDFSGNTRVYFRQFSTLCSLELNTHKNNRQLTCFYPALPVHLPSLGYKVPCSRTRLPCSRYLTKIS